MISISFGFNFFWIFFATSCARNLVDSGISSKCSFGKTKAWPFVSGFNSRIARLFLSSDNLKEGAFPAIIEQNIHCSPRCVRLFCLMKVSTSLVVIDVICSWI